MSTFKKAKVIMLPTDEVKGDFSKERIYPCLLKHSWMFDKEEKGKLIFADSNIRTPTQLQNLYFLSDDEIKEGDYYLSNESNLINNDPEYVVRRCDKINNGWLESDSNPGQGDNPFHSSKIIATTDKFLFFKDKNKSPKQYMGSYISMSLGENLPQPSRQFIEKYVEEYNKGNVITDVLVEYEIQRQCVKCKTIRSHYLCKCGEQDNYENTLQLKINPKDNSLNICFID